VRPASFLFHVKFVTTLFCSLRHRRSPSPLFLLFLMGVGDLRRIDTPSFTCVAAFGSK